MPVTFTLLQGQGTHYMVIKEGTVSVGDTIAGTNNNIVPTRNDPYVDLPRLRLFCEWYEDQDQGCAESS